MRKVWKSVSISFCFYYFLCYYRKTNSKYELHLFRTLLIPNVGFFFHTNNHFYNSLATRWGSYNLILFWHYLVLASDPPSIRVTRLPSMEVPVTSTTMGCPGPTHTSLQLGCSVRNFMTSPQPFFSDLIIC